MSLCGGWAAERSGSTTVFRSGLKDSLKDSADCSVLGKPMEKAWAGPQALGHAVSGGLSEQGFPDLFLQDF